jgi:hypothetical protein
MSKYRRKTANLRERLRMGEINSAFENLRQKLPNPAQSGKGKCEKLTKINILHVAINYIRAMENLLETGDSGIRSFSEMTKNPLRDENESKLEMQRILQVLMKKAEAKAAAAAAGGRGGAGGSGNEERRSNGRNRRFGAEAVNGFFGGPDQDIKFELDDDDEEDEEDEDDDLDDDDDDLHDLTGEGQKETSASSSSSSFPDWKPFSPVFQNTPPGSSGQPLTCPSFPVASTPKFSRSLSSFAASFSVSPASLSSTDSSVSPEAKRQPDPLFSAVAFDSAVAVHSSDEMIKEFFTDFVDMVDTLPDIDFEEQFEMFP